MLVARVSDLFTLLEKDTSTIKELLVKLFADWSSRLKEDDASPRVILAQKLQSLGLISQANQLLEKPKCDGTFYTSPVNNKIIYNILVILTASAQFNFATLYINELAVVIHY